MERSVVTQTVVEKTFSSCQLQKVFLPSDYKQEKKQQHTRKVVKGYFAIAK